MVTVYGIGVFGYRLIGGGAASWVDAVYMTAITLTTVGYREVVPVSGSPVAELFTVGLLLAGVGSFLYLFSNVTAFLVEGHFHRVFRERMMKRRVDAMSGHFIVCGGGHTGEHILRELVGTSRGFVLIEADPARVEELSEETDFDIVSVTGDATDDRVLQAAGVERAAGLAACISNDKDNLVITLSARILNPKLRIVSRCIEQGDEHKIRKAGADAVVSPNAMGGLRMVSELVRPTAVSFLDQMLREGGTSIRIEQVDVEDGSYLDGRSLKELAASGVRDLLVLALVDESGRWEPRPKGDTQMSAGNVVIFVAAPDERQEMERLATAPT